MRLTCICLLSLSLALPPAQADDKPPTITGLWEGTLKAGVTELRLGFNVSAKPDGSFTATMDSVDQGARNITIDKVVFESKKLTLELTKLNASYSGALSDDGKTFGGEWKQAGLTFPLELRRVDKFSEVRRPQLPKKPYPYLEEDVVVDNEAAGVKLAGTLMKPRDDGPFRTAILITGSGAQDRDETLFNHKPFLVLADHLTRNGIAVLRCDDRGVGKSTGDHAKATTADFATDTRAMAAFLKTRKDIKEIGLIGHSEGGLIAPIIAAGNPDIAFVVLLAGPGVPGEEILVMQAQAMLKAAKADEKALQWQHDLQAKLLKLIKDGSTADKIKSAFAEAMKEAPDSIRKQAGDQITAQFQLSEKMLTSAWLRFFLTYDPRDDMKKVRCPVLALNGAKDLQVPPKKNLEEIEKALKAGGNKNVTVRELPELNHLFQTCKTGLPDEYGKIEETFAPIALDAICDWVKNLK